MEALVPEGYALTLPAMGVISESHAGETWAGTPLEVAVVFWALAEMEATAITNATVD